MATALCAKHSESEIYRSNIEVCIRLLFNNLHLDRIGMQNLQHLVRLSLSLNETF